MEKPRHETGIRGFYYAFKGLSAVLRSELNARIHTVVATFVIVFGFLFGISRTEWLIIIICTGMVFMAEIFNTAVERITDMVSPEINEKAGMVKDMAAGAVLVSVIASVVAGMVIFIPYVKETINRLIS